MKYYFAKLDSNNNVTNVYAVAHKDCLDSDGSASETVGINFLNNLVRFLIAFGMTFGRLCPEVLCLFLVAWCCLFGVFRTPPHFRGHVGLLPGVLPGSFRFLPGCGKNHII